MSILNWTYLFVGLSFSLYLFIAWRVRVRDTQGFYVAGRDVPAYANGMATAADWMSAASFYFHGWTNLDHGLCWQCLFDGLDRWICLTRSLLSPI